jgi:hypothetical protein
LNLFLMIILISETGCDNLVLLYFVPWSCRSLASACVEGIQPSVLGPGANDATNFVLWKDFYYRGITPITIIIAVHAFMYHWL